MGQRSATSVLWCSSAAGDAHVAGDGGLSRAPIDDEIVALGLARDRLIDGACEERIVPARSQWCAQVGGVILAQAHVERAGTREAHTVAALTEIVRHRRDEAEAPTGL